MTEQAENPKAFFDKVFEVIDKYNLSHSYIKDIVPQELKDKWIKTYYAKFNKQGFNQLKFDYNSNKEKNVLHLYLLLICGFNHMLRFNSKGEYNLPVGNVDFNKNTLVALQDYLNIKPRVIDDFITFLETNERLFEMN